VRSGGHIEAQCCVPRDSTSWFSCAWFSELRKKDAAGSARGWQRTCSVAADVLLHVPQCTINVLRQPASEAQQAARSSRGAQPALHRGRRKSSTSSKTTMMTTSRTSGCPTMLGRMRPGSQTRVLDPGHHPGLLQTRRCLTAGRPGGRSCRTSCLSRPSETAATPGAPSRSRLGLSTTDQNLRTAASVVFTLLHSRECLGILTTRRERPDTNLGLASTGTTARCTSTTSGSSTARRSPEAGQQARQVSGLLDSMQLPCSDCAAAAAASHSPGMQGQKVLRLSQMQPLRAAGPGKKPKASAASGGAGDWFTENGEEKVFVDGNGKRHYGAQAYRAWKRAQKGGQKQKTAPPKRSKRS